MSGLLAWPRRRPPAGPRRDTGGSLIYAIGDVHGRYDLLKALLSAVAADVAQSGVAQGGAGRRPHLIFCGDYVDRGPQSHLVLEALLELKARSDFAVHALKGNHEDALLHFLDDPQSGALWLPNGGDATLAAYGVEPPPDGAPAEAWIRARDAFLRAMPSSHLRLLQQLDLMLVIGAYAFVHAGLRPGAPLSAQTEADLLWIRQPFIASEGPFEKIVVHGHTWVDAQPQLLAHRIGVDTGAYLTGVLTAARLDGEEIRFLQARL